MRSHAGGAPAVSAGITPREREILGQIVEGHSNAEIAAGLRLSIKTVEWHRMNLMKKMKVHNVAHLIRYALEYGLVEIHLKKVGAK